MQSTTLCKRLWKESRSRSVVSPWSLVVGLLRNIRALLPLLRKRSPVRVADRHKFHLLNIRLPAGVVKSKT